MNRYLLLLLSIAASGAAAETTAFLNVNVIPMTAETVVENQTVIVSDGIVAAIGNVDKVPVPDASAPATS